MTITLITQEQYDRLLTIQQQYPALTFQNKGYEYINTSVHANEAEEVTSILSKSITRFRKFNNFYLNSKEEPRVRFQYDWSADESRTIPFTGVGYLKLTELLNSFEKPDLDL